MNVFTNEDFLGELRDALMDEDRLPKYRGDPNMMRGQCYVACEVIMHGKLGGTVTPMTVRVNGDVHWFLKSKLTPVTYIDPTADQFDTPVPYLEGRGRGFLTKAPSKRAQKILERLGWTNGSEAPSNSTTSTGRS
jgi:hypothetical protein